jgi:hypothetical protein
MRRRESSHLWGASVTWPFLALAQEPGRTYRIGCLLPLTRDAPVNVAFSTNFDAVVSLKAKTSSSNGALMDYIRT